MHSIYATENHKGYGPECHREIWYAFISRIYEVFESDKDPVLCYSLSDF